MQTLENLGTSSHKPSNERLSGNAWSYGWQPPRLDVGSEADGGLSGRLRGNKGAPQSPRQLVFTGAYYNGQGAGSTQEPSSGELPALEHNHHLLEPQLLVSQRKILNKINSRNWLPARV